MQPASCWLKQILPDYRRMHIVKFPYASDGQLNTRRGIERATFASPFDIS